ncbi:AMP-binding protein [Lactobacillus taiwanensis]|uniref:AMP-binding protein n=1 Tax=Lactobacillus taiwanensis TaxID=508451 RepID=UPI0025A949B7|nr:AMP-binding protein [Lactobacillus taiwanensis]
MNKLLKKYNEVVQERFYKTMLKTHTGEKLTYGEFDKKVNSLAEYLNKQFNNKIIPVLSSDNLDYLITMIACWKINKVYMPINFNTPSERIKSTLSRINTKTILIRNYSEKIKQIKQIPFDFSETPCESFKQSSISEIAYILSTSGTTGNPKMVQVSFENLYWLLNTMNKAVPFREDDTFIISTPPQFDVSFHENLSFIFGKGILQFIAPGTPIQQFKRLKNILVDDDITHIALSPTSLKTILSMTKEKIKVSKLKNIILAGEALPVNLVNQLMELLPKTRILNCYGPTESTIYATSYLIDTPVETDTVPIGTPLEGAKIKFYNSNGINPNKGEILIGGKGVSKGYFDNPKLTAEKFITYENTTYYKTGDLGFIRNGLIYYQGRKDRQVKINGIRIELEEIEQVIHKYLDEFTNFNVLKVDNNLVLFSDQKINFEALQKFMKLHLPAYMIPNHYIKVPEMRLTASNKLDTKYLKSEFTKKYSNITTHENTSNKESIIKNVISEILAEPFLDETTNLMLLPQMDSLTQIEIIVALEEQYQVDLPEDFIKKAQTIREIRKVLDSSVIKNIAPHSTALTTSQKQNQYSNLKNIRDLNNFILKQGKSFYKDSYYLQKSYIVDNFKQVLEVKVTLPKNINNILKVENVLYKVIEKNELLRTIIHKDNKLNIFAPYEHKIPVISSSLLHNLKENIITDLKNVIYNKLLWEVYFDDVQNELHFFINHLIADQSSLGIIEKDIISVANGETLENSPSFSDFVKFINEHSSEDTLEKVFIQGFKNVTTNDFFSKVYDPEKNYFKVKTPYKKQFDNIVFGNYILSKLLCKSQDRKIVSGSTIINLREFNKEHFTSTFGDIHTTIPFIYKVDENESMFKKSFSKIYSYFLTGDNVTNSIYKNYPNISKDLKKYEFYLDDNLKFSNNFLGAVREKDLDKTITKLVKQQYSLENFSKTKLYCTFFSCGNELIFVPITQKLLKI